MKDVLDKIQGAPQTERAAEDCSTDSEMKGHVS